MINEKLLWIIAVAVALIGSIIILGACMDGITNDTTPPDEPIIDNTPTTDVTVPSEDKTDTVVTGQATRIHILGSQTLQNQYVATSGNTWGIITLLNCRFTIKNGMIKISGSIGTNYVTVETSVQNVLIVY